MYICESNTFNFAEYSNSVNVFSLKRKGKKIHVQPTAISRRHRMALGKSTANTGRPRNRQHLKNHDYSCKPGRVHSFSKNIENKSLK